MATSERRSKRSAVATATPPAAATMDPAEALSVGARQVAAAIAGPGAASSRDEWLAVVGNCQSLINTLTAVQDTAIAEAARRESVWCEDGTLGETVHVPGRVTLDAADVIAPGIGATHPQAQRRVEQAVRLAARRVPVPAEQRDLPESSGLGGLHEAMAAGQLDGYRAGVIAFELEVAPADVADAIVAALSGHLGEDSSSLRRRTRVLLSRISPDLVRERAQKARAQTGLRRWVAEPGVDEWHGTFPSEDAASAWAAIDRLAHDLVAGGTCTNIEQARGKALTDLVTGNSTVDVQIVLTVPADSQPTPQTLDAIDVPVEPPSSDSPRPASGDPSSETAAMTRGGLATAEPQSSETPRPASSEPSSETAAMTRGGLATAEPQSSETPRPASSEPSFETAAVPRGGPAAAEPDEDLTHPPPPHPPTTTGSDDDLVEVQGSRPSEPLLVRRGWLRDHLSTQPQRPKRTARQAPPRFVPCDPLTGARLDPADHLATDAYRPGAELAALVRARDGRCRFPGCSVAARFCDLDHVRPWPLGRTTATNLLTLCRRHHRIKQRPGWRLRLAPDGSATWTDPTGLARTTAPLNALLTLVLVAHPAPAPPVPHPAPVTRRPDPAPLAQPSDRPASAALPDLRPDAGPAVHQPGSLTPTTATPAPGELPLAHTAATPVWSALETHLTFRADHHPQRRLDHGLRTHPTHHRCTSAAELRAGLARWRFRSALPTDPPF